MNGASHAMMRCMPKRDHDVMYATRGPRPMPELARTTSSGTLTMGPPGVSTPATLAIRMAASPEPWPKYRATASCGITTCSMPVRIKAGTSRGRMNQMRESLVLAPIQGRPGSFQYATRANPKASAVSMRVGRSKGAPRDMRALYTPRRAVGCAGRRIVRLDFRRHAHVGRRSHDEGGPRGGHGQGLGRIQGLRGA